MNRSWLIVNGYYYLMLEQQSLHACFFCALCVLVQKKMCFLLDRILFGVQMTKGKGLTLLFL